MNRIRVLLADDHVMFLAGLRMLLETDFEIVGAVTDGKALCTRALLLQPDVIVADISMPLLNGIDAVRSLAADGCRAKVIFLSMHGDVLFRKQAMSAGAAAYILKRDAPDDLIASIRSILTHKKPGTRSNRQPPLDHSAGAENAGALTPRQREIWQLLSEGRTPKEIAALLRVSVRTVEFHKYRLWERLKVRSGAELTVLAVKHGLIR